MSKLCKPILPSILALAALSLANNTASSAEPSYEPMANYHASSIFAQVGQPVGRLNIKTDKGGFSCTGFLISEKYLMTNHHCIDDKWYNPKTKKSVTQKIAKISFQLGYVNAKDKATAQTFRVKLPVIEANEQLDYAILEVEGNPADQFGYLSIVAEKPVPKMPLWIIGHPRGKPQQISRTQCLSIKPIRKARNRLQHTCPAVTGSSGSPVFDASTGQVIAIHHAGYTTNSNQNIGLAVLLVDIADQSELLRDIIDAQ